MIYVIATDQNSLWKELTQRTGPAFKKVHFKIKATLGMLVGELGMDLIYQKHRRVLVV